MASILGKHLLRVKSKAENFALFALYPCYFFVCSLAAPWLTFDQSLLHLMLIIVFGLTILVQRLLGGVGSLLLIRCPVGFDHNDITHLPTRSKLQKILSPDLHPVSPKCEISPIPKTPPIPKTVIASHCIGLQVCIIPHLMQSLVFKILVFVDQSNQ